MTKLKIGFIGVGNMGQAAHLRNYATLEGCEVVALAEPRPELARRVAERYAVARTYASAAEMLEREQLDGLVAVQPFDRHGQLIAPLYASKLPIFTEKPLAASVEIGRRMVEALEHSGSWHMVGYHKRSDPATMLVKAELERLRSSGEWGRMRLLRLTMPEGNYIQNGFDDLIQTGEAVPPTPADLRADWNDPYLLFVNYYIHQVNLMRHLFGEPYRVTYADPSGVVMGAQSIGGVPGILEMTPYRSSQDWQESAFIGFDSGFIQLELPAPLALHRAGRVKLFSDLNGKAQTLEPTLPPVHAMKQQALNFLAAIRGECAPICTAQEALLDLETARDYINLLSQNTGGN